MSRTNFLQRTYTNRSSGQEEHLYITESNKTATEAKITLDSVDGPIVACMTLKAIGFGPLAPQEARPDMIQIAPGGEPYIFNCSHGCMTDT
jgi:hypothetical protein